MEPVQQLSTRQILSVSQLVHRLKSVVNDQFAGVWVRGEITGVKSFGSGHAYPTIKDSEAQLSCALFKGVTQKLKFKLEEGLSVLAFGRLDIYAPRGSCQFIIQDLEPDGIGALQLAFEQLKKKLQTEGLFATERKRPLPFLPKRVAIVTSWHGAALHDMLVTLKRRFANIEVLIYPVAVQGDKSAGEIAHAINCISQNHSCDVMIVGRGGGSMEDLWAFNEEIVARAIAAATMPVISAVGHETDFTIADFVADLRAATPTAAAELAVPDKLELIAKLSGRKSRLVMAQKNILERAIARLAAFKKALPTPQKVWQDWHLHLGLLEDRLYQSFVLNLREKTHQLSTLQIKLQLLAPQNILQRGFVLAKTKEGRVVTHKEQLKSGDLLELVFQDGSIWSEIKL